MRLNIEDTMPAVDAGTRAGASRVYPSAPSEAIFAALDASPLPTTFVRPDLIYRFVNRSYERWFGLQWNDVVGKSLEQVIGRAASETVMPFALTALKGASVQFESTLPYPNRGNRRMRIVYAGAKGPSGEVVGFFAFLEDITAVHDAESAVNAALDGMGDGYFTVDRQMRFTHVNQAAAELYGLPAKDMLNRSIDVVFPGASQSATGLMLREVLETRKPQRRTLPSAGLAGQPFLWDVVPLLTGGAAVVMQKTPGQRT